jgi:uncharacterized membrane protein
LWPVFLTYVLSFVYIGIYWNNHHHMFQAVERVDGGVLWANMFTLFWISLIPFVTGWMGENHFASLPMALYGVVLLGAGVGYALLAWTLRRIHAEGSVFARALGTGTKEKVSLVCYLAAIPLAFATHWGAFTIYVLVGVLWLIPDRRYARQLTGEAKETTSH